MAKNNKFSGPTNLSLPSMASFKKTEPIREENVPAEKQKETTGKPVTVKKDDFTETDGVSQKSGSDDPEKNTEADGLDLLRLKVNAKRTHFTTTISDDAQKKIKKMSLALDLNINEIVENAINMAFNAHEKEILRLLKKKLL